MEHEDEYNKPWEVWAYEKCRECSHYKYMHLLLGPTELTKHAGIVGECQQILDTGGFCSCLEWMPPDNLDYIELLAKKKGIISDKKDNIE